MKTLLPTLTDVVRSPSARRALDLAAAFLPVAMVAVACAASLVPALHDTLRGCLPDLGWVVTRRSHYDPTRDPRLRFPGEGVLALTVALSAFRRALARVG